MKKAIIPIILILAIIGAVIYFFVATPASSAGFAKAVPAETMIYFGSSGERTLGSNLQHARQARIERVQRRLDKLTKKAEDMGEAGAFAISLLNLVVDRIANDKPVPGVPETPAFAIYTIGIVPVARVQVKDAKAFRKFLATAAQKAGVKAATGHYKNIRYMSFALSDDGDVRSTMLVAVRPHFAVITLDTPKFRSDMLGLALGLEAPHKSLADVGKLAKSIAGTDLSRVCSVLSAIVQLSLRSRAQKAALQAA